MLPGRASVGNYGGVLKDYSAPSDSSTDRPAAGGNQAYADAAAMTKTAPRAWVRLTLKASGATPVIVDRDELWNNTLNAAPAAIRVTAGHFRITYPSTVVDEIPSNMPGYTGPRALALRAGWANDRGSTTWNDVKVVPTAANVLDVYFWTFSGGAPLLADPAGDTDVDVYAV